MRLVRYDRFGGIEELSVDEVAAPQAAAGEVVVRVEASCINPGSVPALEGAPYVPIRDLAGTVVALGEQVRGVEFGDEVLGWLQDWAAHAELVAVPAEQLIAKPAGLSWDVAGSLFVGPMAGLAAVETVAPREGEIVVVAGASGGVGLTAAQLARRRGATVIGVASRDSASRLDAYGVVPVAYGGDVAADIRSAAGGRQVDAFVDAFGSGYVEIALSLGVARERINTVVDYQAAREHGVSAKGTADAGGVTGLRQLAELAASGALDVPIAATYPLDAVQDAYRKVAAGRAPGRVVLHPQE